MGCLVISVALVGFFWWLLFLPLMGGALAMVLVVPVVVAVLYWKVTGLAFGPTETHLDRLRREARSEPENDDDSAGV